MYIVFFELENGERSHTRPFQNYWAAVDAALSGPVGAQFNITEVSDPGNYRAVALGVVPPPMWRIVSSSYVRFGHNRYS